MLRSGGTIVPLIQNGGDFRSAAEYPDIRLLMDRLVFAGVDRAKGLLTRSGFGAVDTRGARRDTLAWTAKNCAKRLLGRPVKLGWPGRSPIRTVFFKARPDGAVDG